MQHPFKLIPLTQGKSAIVDAKDYKWLNQWKWHLFTAHKRYFYAARYSKEEGGQIFMHRQILNIPKGMESDHINHNGLDNRRINIRACTTAQNQQNGTPRKAGSSQYRGVSWNSQKRRWRAQINCNGQQTKLGYFVNEIEAAKAYDKKAKELHKKFANINFKD